MSLIMLAIIAIAALVVTFVAVKQYRGERYLCDDCQFNSPEKCHKKERPQAVECYAYLPEEKAS
ncbi:MAG: hypothetical protein K2Y22_04610 [Candidatus Obscuribacterales bacterium]|nr:hypothetical protein [Candidatus Obscuribacterales bacterium]